MTNPPAIDVERASEIVPTESFKIDGSSEPSSIIFKLKQSLSRFRTESWQNISTQLKNLYTIEAQSPLVANRERESNKGSGKAQIQGLFRAFLLPDDIIGVHQEVSQDGPPCGVRTARQRGHHQPHRGHQRPARDHGESRRRRLQSKSMAFATPRMCQPSIPIILDHVFLLHHFQAWCSARSNEKYPYESVIITLT